MKQLNKSLFTILVVAMIFSLGVNISFSQVTDIDNNLYKTVVIGDQVWMAENLNVEHYRNGDIIQQVQDKEVWKTTKTGAWCYYNNDPANSSKFGKLYNWDAVNDPRGLAPEGWHIPSDAEWTQLVNYLGGEEVAGGKLKSVTLWKKPNKDANNSSGFSGIPSGSFYFNSFFPEYGTYAGYWSSTAYDDFMIWTYTLYFSTSDMKRANGYNKTDGYSIRCIKD